MLKLLIKKQIIENFRGYFYNTKTNKGRSKLNTIFLFILFAFLIVGVIGGMSTGFSIFICKPMVDVGMGWLYFLFASSFAIIIGVFGSIFTTYSCLYLSKDNDLLLSMPIPIKYIVISRLLNVFLMGALFSFFSLIPSMIVYFVVANFSILIVFCNIILFFIITFFVLILSCLLGFVVAKISLVVKNKSFVTLLFSLMFLGAYYFCYFKAQALISKLIENITYYGDKIKGSAYILYQFGRIGEGYILPTIIYALAILILLLLTFLLLKNTFLSIAISTGKSKKKTYIDKPLKQKSVLNSLIKKDLTKFVSSSTYMLNCGFSFLLIPIVAIVYLIQGKNFSILINGTFPSIDGAMVIIICAIMLLLNSMNDFAVPSISLEGKNLWVLKTLPISSKKILQAKLSVQIILSLIPVVFALICIMIALESSIIIKLLICVFVLLSVLCSSNFNLFLGIKMPMLSWSNEIVPIKQSGAVGIALFSSFGITTIFAFLYFKFFKALGIVFYLSIWCCLFLILTIILFLYIIKKGVKIFESL